MSSSAAACCVGDRAVASPPSSSSASVEGSSYVSYVCDCGRAARRSSVAESSARLKSSTRHATPMLAHVLRLHPGDDLFPSINEFIKKEEIEAGAILSVAGSLTNVCLRFANNSSVTSLTKAHYEVVSLTGTLSHSGGSHLHMSVADGRGVMIGGHLADTGNIVYTTMEIVIGFMPDIAFNRELDATYGWDELTVHQC